MFNDRNVRLLFRVRLAFLKMNVCQVELRSNVQPFVPLQNICRKAVKLGKGVFHIARNGKCKRRAKQMLQYVVT